MNAEDAVLLAWTVGIVCLVIGAFLIIWSGAAHGAELSISGTSIGHGVHCLSFSGDLNASILQGLNNSSWRITAAGAV